MQLSNAPIYNRIAYPRDQEETNSENAIDEETKNLLPWSFRSHSKLKLSTHTSILGQKSHSAHCSICTVSTNTTVNHDASVQAPCHNFEILRFTTIVVLPQFLPITRTLFYLEGQLAHVVNHALILGSRIVANQFTVPSLLMTSMFFCPPMLSSCLAAKRLIFSKFPIDIINAEYSLPHHRCMWSYSYNLLARHSKLLAKRKKASQNHAV